MKRRMFRKRVRWRRQAGRRDRRVVGQADRPECGEQQRRRRSAEAVGRDRAEAAIEKDAERGAERPGAARDGEAKRFRAHQLAARNGVHDVEVEGDVQTRHAEHPDDQPGQQPRRAVPREQRGCGDQSRGPERVDPAPRHQADQKGNEQAAHEARAANRGEHQADPATALQRGIGLERDHRGNGRPCHRLEREQEGESRSPRAAHAGQPDRVANVHGRPG